ncbi:MAG: hypothetical protein CM1200mP41_37620 [Gammaproteobacteria bacterium]|nr:MAG: hypothetical protein CM1200mP41_37620 [Gammaproteobacteria bacterium]
MFLSTHEISFYLLAETTGPAIIEENGSTSVIPLAGAAECSNSVSCCWKKNLIMKPQNTPASDLNPITLEVVCESLITIVREMRATIIRASYSSNIYEFEDFSCALFDGSGQLVAQSWDHPGHVFSSAVGGANVCSKIFENDLQPGDAILLNDPHRGEHT